MLNSSTANRRQVDDFNTVAGPPAPPPLPTATDANDRKRLDSARSDPGVRGGGGGSGGGSGGGGGDTEKKPTVETPTLTPSLAEEPAAAVVTVAGEEPRTPQSPSLPPAESTPSGAATSAESPALLGGDREVLARSQPANTPTTPFTDLSRRLGASRPSQRTATTQRGLYYEHAVNLVAARCATDPRSAGRRSGGDLDPPPGFGGARFFYVRQERPRPMTPLKAWSGYHGNVYFSPLRIEQARYSHPDSLLSLPSLPACSGPLQRVLESSRLNADHLMHLRARAAAAPRQPKRRRWAAGGGGGGGQQWPVAELDRAYLVSRGGGSVADSRDVHLYRSAHATGTLQFQQQQRQRQQPEVSQQLQQPQPQATSGGASCRVYRGSVSRKLRDLKQVLAGPQPLPLPPTGESSPLPPEPHLHQNPQQQQHHHHQQAAAGRHNTSMVSLDMEIDRLYDRMPSLMSQVPRAQVRRQQMRGLGAGGGR